MARKGHVKAATNHDLALIGQRVDDPYNISFEELNLIDGYNLSRSINEAQQLFSLANWKCGEANPIVRAQLLNTIVSIVNRTLEGLDTLFGEKSSPNTPNQLGAFPAEHRPCNDLYPPLVPVVEFIHSRSIAN